MIHAYRCPSLVPNGKCGGDEKVVLGGHCHCRSHHLAYAR